MATLQEWLDRIHQGVEVADLAVEVGSTATPDIIEALVAAEMDATSYNVERVFELYARAGIVPPARLTAHLLLINEQQHPEDTVRGDITPWLVVGGIVAYLLLRKRR